MHSVLNIGTLGHIDHGKTSLTRAITGAWTDRHSESIKRNMTIKLGYADAVIKKCDGCTAPRRTLRLINAPMDAPAPRSH